MTLTQYASSRRLATVLTASCLLVALGGCGYGSGTTWSDGSRVNLGVRADHVGDLQTRVVPLEVPAGAETVRVRNLAGRVTLRHDDGDTVRIQATVHAKGVHDTHTQELLETMTWVERRDEQGRPVWTLDYPVDRHPTLHCVTPGGRAGGGFEVRTTRWSDRTITVTTMKTPGVPTLFADLAIVYPRDGSLDVRTLAGPVDGAQLSGRLTATAMAGTVEIAAFHGGLLLETGSGDIFVGESDGRLHADTGSGDLTLGSAAGDVRARSGSGDVRVESLRAEAYLETGSGDIEVRHAVSERLEADTGSGDITIGGGSARRLHVDTGSGNIQVSSVEFVEMHGETGSGRIVVRSGLAEASRISLGSGSGDIVIIAGPDASFDFRASTGSGRVNIGFRDATVRHDGRRVLGAHRGDGRTRIDVGTGSGDCTIRPGGATG